MFCPLMSKPDAEGGMIWIACQENQCAWWDAITGRCAILDICKSLQFGVSH